MKPTREEFVKAFLSITKNLELLKFHTKDDRTTAKIKLLSLEIQNLVYLVADEKYSKKGGKV